MAKRRKPRSTTSDPVKLDGALALSFVNTSARSRRSLASYTDLVVWGQGHGSLSAAEAGRLRALAAERPEQAADAFAAAEDLHALLSRIFNALGDHEEPPPGAVDSLNADLVYTVPPRRIVAHEADFRLGWAIDRKDDLGRALWRVVLSATDVLTSKDRGRVVRCAGEDCGLLFVAHNPGSPRKWCHMAACGRRFNSSRHYHAKVKGYRAEIRQKVDEQFRGSPLERLLLAAEQLKQEA